MEKSLSWKAACSSASQEIAHILCSTEVDYHFDNNLPPVTVLRHVNPLTIILSFPLRSFIILVFLFNCNIHCHVCVCPSRHLRWHFPAKTLYACLFSLLPSKCHMPCPYHPPWFDHRHNTEWAVPIIQSWSSSACSFLQAPVTPPGRPEHLHQCLSSDTLSLCPSLVWDTICYRLVREVKFVHLTVKMPLTKYNW